MKKLFVFFIVLILFSGCTEMKKEQRYMAAIKTCEKQNGVAMLNEWGRMTKCNFPNNKYNIKN